VRASQNQTDQIVHNGNCKAIAWDENCDDKATQFGVLHWLVRSKQVSGTLFSEHDWDFNIAVDDPDDFNAWKFFGGPAASGLN
jgi:hypothetical protein